MEPRFEIVLSHPRGAESQSMGLQRELVDQLRQRPDLHVSLVPHLYDLVSGGPAVAHLRQISGDFVVLGWLYPRAAYWVLRANGIEGRMGATAFFPSEELESSASGDSDRTIWCVDLRAHAESDGLVAELERIAGAALGRALKKVAPPPGGNGLTTIDEMTAPRWYPVVDYDRCGNCLDCLNFCLFGVYGLDAAGRLLVEQPDACRDGCPACSRVCPNRAIIFPHHADPSIAGDTTAKSPMPEGLVGLQGLGSIIHDAHGEPRPFAGPVDETDELDQLVDRLDEDASD